MSNKPHALQLNATYDPLRQSQYVDTMRILPSAQSEQYVTFQLPQSGILDAPTAYIKLQLKNDANGTKRLPMSAGIWGCVQSASLMYDGVKVQEMEEVGHYQALKHFWKSQHFRDNKSTIRTGQITPFRLGNSDAGAGGNQPLADNGTIGKFVVDKTNPAVETSNPNTAGESYNTSSAYRCDTDVSSSAEWRLYLHEMFNCLQSAHLPLGALDGRFSITLTLKRDQNGHRLVNTGGNVFTGNNTILQSGTELVADVFYFDDPVGEPSTIEQLRNQMNKEGINILYTQPAFIQQNIPASGVALGNIEEQKVNATLGLNGAVVRRILWATPRVGNPGADNDPGNELFGAYCSNGSMTIVEERTGAAPGNYSYTLRDDQEEFQVNINAEPVFNTAPRGDNMIWNYLCECSPHPYRAVRPAYTWEGQVYIQTQATQPASTIYNRDLNQGGMSSRTFNGHPQSVIAGMLHYYGVNLSRTYVNEVGAGLVIGDRPVELSLTKQRTAENASALYWLIWAEEEKMMVMRNNSVSVSS